MHVSELVDAASVERLLDSFRERRGRCGSIAIQGRAETNAATSRPSRAPTADAPSTAGDFVIVDTEYDNGRRIFDLVGFDRAGLPRPRLIYVEPSPRVVP